MFKLTQKFVLSLAVMVILSSANLMAAIGVKVIPNSWYVGTGGARTWVSPTTFTVQNIGTDPAKVKIRATNTQNWTLGTAPALNTFAMQHGDGTTWNSITTGITELVPSLAGGGSSSFYLRYQSPTTLSDITLTETQFSTITITAVSPALLPPATSYTLITFLIENKVTVVDSMGTIVREITGLYPRDADRLSNGNILVCDYLDGGRIFEVDEKETVVWELRGLQNPYDADKLSNGNILVAEWGGRVQRIIEVKPSGEIVYEKVIPDMFAYDVDRLPNNNTLVFTGIKVFEIDPTGTEVWQLSWYPTLRKGESPTFRKGERLPNGNTLIAICGAKVVSGEVLVEPKVIEVDRAGNIVWQKTGLWGSFDATRLSNGDTLIAYEDGVIEVDTGGTIIWERKGAPATDVERF